jgi:predicted NBD/HSP70 family sugar kinase
MKVFIGVDYNEHLLTIGFVGPQGILKGFSIQSSPLLNEPETFGQTLNSTVRSLRGEENLRMKDFQAIGIGIPSRYANSETFNGIKEQIRQFLNIEVYIDDRDKLSVVGNNWLRNVARVINPRLRPSLNMVAYFEHQPDIQDRDLSIIYGAAKLAMDSIHQEI